MSYVVPVKSKRKISQTFVAFSEYINFKCEIDGKDFVNFCDLTRKDEVSNIVLFDQQEETSNLLVPSNYNLLSSKSYKIIFMYVLTKTQC